MNFSGSLRLSKPNKSQTAPFATSEATSPYLRNGQMQIEVCRDCVADYLCFCSRVIFAEEKFARLTTAAHGEATLRQRNNSGRGVSNKTTILLEAALNHIGITKLPHFLVNRLVAEKRVVVLLDEWSANEIGIYGVLCFQKICAARYARVSRLLVARS